MPIEKHIVSRDEAIYEAWPDLIQTESGKLICVFSECEHHLNRSNQRLVITESTDRGRSWSPKKPLTEITNDGNFFNCPRISKLRDGRLAILCDRILKSENQDAELYLWYGDKEGKEWSAPIKLPFFGIVPDKLLELTCGRLLVAAHFLNPETGKLEQYLWYSDDKGESWSDRVTVAASPLYNLCEVSLLDCGNGVLVAFLRENSRIGCDVLKVISHDNGESWSEIYATAMDCGHRPVSGFLKDGTVMVTYRFIPNATQNFFAAFFDKEAALEIDRGAQRVRIMPLDYDRNASPDLGYSGWTQFDDGEIYVVNYIKDDSDKAHIRGYSFYPEDVVLPASDNTTKNVF